MLNKTCTICNTTYYSIKINDFAKHFHKEKLGKYGFQARCKNCRFEIEIKPNREKRAEYDRSRRKKIALEQKSCIVCNKMFMPRNEDNNCCSIECTRFKKKVHNKLYMKNKYRDLIKKARQAESKRENSKKPYSKTELDYLIKNIDKSPFKIGIKLKRSTNAIRKKIALLKKASK